MVQSQVIKTEKEEGDNYARSPGQTTINENIAVMAPPLSLIAGGIKGSFFHNILTDCLGGVGCTSRLVTPGEGPRHLVKALFNPCNNYGKGTIVLFMLQMRELRPWEVKTLAQVHTLVIGGSRTQI